METNVKELYNRFRSVFSESDEWKHMKEYRSGYDGDTILESFLKRLYVLKDISQAGKPHIGEKEVVNSKEKDKRNYDLDYIYIDKIITTPQLIKKIQVNLESRKYCFGYLGTEITKFMIKQIKKHQRTKYKTPLEFPENEWYELSYRYIRHLKETVNMPSKDYWDMMQNPKNPKFNRARNYIYYSWWLYSYLPFLDDGEKMMLDLVDKVYLNDAQDALMWGLYNMEPKKLAQFILPFMKHVSSPNPKRPREYCFDLFCRGTGCYSQLTRILTHLIDLGYESEVMTDEMKDFLGEYSYRDMIMHDIYSETQKKKTMKKDKN